MTFFTILGIIVFFFICKFIYDTYISGSKAPDEEKNFKQDVIREHIGNFQNSFSKEQKAAVVASLIIISKADGEAHPRELKYMENIAIVLGIKLDDPIFISMNYNKDLLINTLKRLDQNQKEWLVVTLHGMVAADGRAEDIEIKYALGICEDIGISENKYVEIIEKAQLLSQRFK